MDTIDGHQLGRAYAGTVLCSLVDTNDLNPSAALKSSSLRVLAEGLTAYLSFILMIRFGHNISEVYPMTDHIIPRLLEP